MWSAVVLGLAAGCDRGTVGQGGVPATRTDSSSARPEPPLAYDSAFGPSFTVDSTGKVTPIGKKKP